MQKNEYPDLMAEYYFPGMYLSGVVYQDIFGEGILVKSIQAFLHTANT